MHGDENIERPDEFVTNLMESDSDVPSQFCPYYINRSQIPLPVCIRVEADIIYANLRASARGVVGYNISSGAFLMSSIKPRLERFHQASMN